MRWHSQRKQRKVSAEATLLGEFVWTDLSGPDWPTERVLDVYRLRWQIELVFKRMKSILGLGRLPTGTDDSCRAWLHVKLLATLLTDRLLELTDRFSPWGY